MSRKIPYVDKKDRLSSRRIAGSRVNHSFTTLTGYSLATATACPEMVNNSTIRLHII